MTLTSVLLTMIMIMPAVSETLRSDPDGFWKTLRIAGLYLLYCGAGIAFVLLRVAANPHTNGLAVLGFLLAWILFGVLWLTRLVPRYRQLPAWIDRRFGVIDWVLLAAIAVSAWGCLV